MMKAMLFAYYTGLTLVGLLGIDEAISESTKLTHDERIRCINDSQWSTQQCRDSVVIAFKDEVMVRSNCSLNGGFLTLEHNFCNESDINSLNNFLCADNASFSDCVSWKALTETTTTTSNENITAPADNTTSLPTYISTLYENHYLDNVKNVLDDLLLSLTCKESVRNETTNTTSAWCLNSNASDSLNCSKSESDEVYKRICSATTARVSTTVAKTTTTKMPVRLLINDTMREKILSFVDHNISSTCRWSVGDRISRQLTDTRRVCKMFLQSGEALVSNQICSTDEVLKLTAIFCHLNFRAGLRKIADTEDGRRNQALDIMANDLTTSCHGIMWPQVVQFTGSLANGCNLLKLAASVLVSSGTCTQSDIDKLEPIVCYVEPKDPKVVQFQAKVTHLLSSMDKDCNETMLPEMTNATNEIEACNLWSKKRNELGNDTICTDEDSNLFTSTFCTIKQSTPNSMSYSDISVIFVFLMSTFSHFYNLST